VKKNFLCLFLTILSTMLILGTFSLCNAQGKMQTKQQESDQAGSEESIVAIIDIAAVYALHPMMQYYDPDVDLFIKQPKPGTTFDEFLGIIKNRRNEFQKSFEGNTTEIKRIKNEIDILQQEIKKLGISKAIEASPINQKFTEQIQKTFSEDERKKLLVQRTNEIQKIEKKFDVEIENKNKQLANLLDSYEKIQRSLLKVFYLTPEETSKKFDEINAEIKDTIKLAAKKYGAKVILNANLISTQEESKKIPEKSIAEKKKANSELENMLVEGPNYSKILGVLKTFTYANIKSPLPDRNDSEYQKYLQQMHKDQEKENFSKGYFNRDYIMQLKQVRSLTAVPMIYGGTDVTWFTVISLMVKNGIPKEKAEIISEIILNKSKVE